MYVVYEIPGDNVNQNNRLKRDYILLVSKLKLLITTNNYSLQIIVELSRKKRNLSVTHFHRQ